MEGERGEEEGREEKGMENRISTKYKITSFEQLQLLTS